MKIISIVGARPNFIKATMISKELRKKHKEILIHTGQHYDTKLNKIFFDQLEVPEPNYYLGVGSGTHAQQTGQIMIRAEKIIIKEKPNWVIVYGDINSTLAGALASAKLSVRIANVEAGLRTYNNKN
ncbi:MAG: UDP-N-acetylglucosamine 2-epimerase (non-hydrolyzing), partial [Actinobacteria bacterium]